MSSNEQDDIDEDVLLFSGQNKVVKDQPDSDLLRDLANELDEDEPTGKVSTNLWLTLPISVGGDN